MTHELSFQPDPPDTDTHTTFACRNEDHLNGDVSCARSERPGAEDKSCFSWFIMIHLGRSITVFIKEER